MAPLLLACKRYILLRLGQLRNHESFSNLRAVVMGISDPQIRDRLVGQLDGLEGEITSLRQAATNAQDQNQREIRTQRDQAAEVLHKATTDLDWARQERTFLKVSLVTVLAVVSLYAVIVLPQLIGWQWLLSHDKKIGLQIAFLVGAAGIVWTMIDRHHWWFSLGTVVLGAAFTVIQLL